MDGVCDFAEALERFREAVERFGEALERYDVLVDVICNDLIEDRKCIF